MSNSMMQSNFLVDLSVEQEETIAGGLSIGSVDGIDLRDFQKIKYPLYISAQKTQCKEKH